MTDKTTLRIIHNAGLFSCCTIRLIEIMKYFNLHKYLPDIVDSAAQFAFYKRDYNEDITPLLFAEQPDDMVHTRELVATHEPGEISFGDYTKLCFEDIKPFVWNYFCPSDVVQEMIYAYIDNYAIDYENTCAIFYRGNDKKRECEVTPYADFIEQARLMPSYIRFLVQPDETEFLNAFTDAFPDRCFHFKETPHMRKKDSAIFYELPPEKKTMHAQLFLAAVLVMSRCKHVIMHSGNGAMWLALYRGGMNGVHQFRNKHIY